MHRRFGVARRESLDARARLRDARGERLGISADLFDDLGSLAYARHRVGEGGGLLVEEVVCPLAQLHDASVAGAQLFVGVGDLVVIELMQLERLTEVRLHRLECGLQILRERDAQLGFGEREFVTGGADPLVRCDESLLGPARQIGILGRLSGLLLTFTLAPETCHGSILLSVCHARAVDHP